MRSHLSDQHRPDAPSQTGTSQTGTSQTGTNRLRFRGSGTPRPERDSVAVEEPLQITLAWTEAGATRRRVFTVTMRTPGEDEELALGLLLSEGVIQDSGDVAGLQFTDDGAAPASNELEVCLAPDIAPDWSRYSRNLATHSSCGVCGKTSLKALALKQPPRLDSAAAWLAPQTVTALGDAMRRQQTLFAATGGVHAAALFDQHGTVLCLREDVGRHNALDKLIGWNLAAASAPTPPQCVAALSGRVSFELAQKAVMAAFPVIVAVGAPSSLALDVARQHDLTVIGFASSGGFSVYHGAWRLTRDPA